MDGAELARHWKDPEARDWSDDDHPAGQIYLHLQAIVGAGGRGYGQVGQVFNPDDCTAGVCSLSVSWV
jgi:hypothetical protein